MLDCPEDARVSLRFLVGQSGSWKAAHDLAGKSWLVGGLLVIGGAMLGAGAALGVAALVVLVLPLLMARSR